MGAISYQWSGPASGSLTDPANWTPTGVPGSGDIAGFGQAGSSAGITVAGTDTVGELGIHGDAVTLARGMVKADGLPDASYNGMVGTAIDGGGSLTLGTSTSTATLNTDTLYVGALSKGSLTVNAGSTLADTDGYIGDAPNSVPVSQPDGSVTVTGSGADWTTHALTMNGGSLAVDGGGTVSVGTTLDEIGGSITLSHGTLRADTLDVAGSLSLDASSRLTGTIDLNGGTIDATGSGPMSLSNTIDLEGTKPLGRDIVNAGGTELTLTGALRDVNGAGALGIECFVRLSNAGNTYSGGTVLDSGANLRVAANGAAATGAIIMNASDVTLAIAPGVALANTVEGFQQGDQVVLAGLTATSASWSNGVLTVDDGTTTVARLNLAGDYTGASFSVAGNGKGDSVISVGGYERTLDWTGATGNGNFETPLNWSPVGAPTSKDVAEFTGTGSTSYTVTGPGTAGEIRVGADVTFESANGQPVSFTTAGAYDGALNLTAGLSVDDGGTLAVDRNVTVDGGAAYIGAVTGGGTLDLNGGTLTDTTASLGYAPGLAMYSPDGTANIAAGTWTVGQTLAARDSTVNVTGGTVSVGATADFNDSTLAMTNGSFSAQQISLHGGSTLEFQQNANVTGTIDLAHGTVTGIGNGGFVILTNDLTLSEDSASQGADTLSSVVGTLEVAGAIADGAGTSPGLTIRGAVLLSHPGNTYTGGTTLSGRGTGLQLSGRWAAGSGDITFTDDEQSLSIWGPGGLVDNTIDGFRPSDSIDMFDVQATSATWQNGTLTLFNGTTAIRTLPIAANPGSLNTDYSVLQFTATPDDGGGTDITVGQPTYANTVTLTTGADTVAGTAGNDQIVAAAGTLSAGDTIDGGGGLNALQLQGGGIFHLNAPTSLDHIQILYASEGGTSSDQQNVFLRNGTNLAVEVQGSSDNPKAPWLNSITIHGADNSDTIFCGPGYDTVVLGSGTETVVGGSGAVGIVADIGMLGGATLSGGSGGGTLLVTGSGGGGMSDTITRIQTVVLSDTSPLGSYQPFDFTANALKGLTVIGTSTGDTIQAGGADQTLVGYDGSGDNSGIPHQIGGFATLVGSSQGYDTFSGHFADLENDTIENFGVPGDVIDVTDVAPADLSVSYGEMTPQAGLLLTTSGGGEAPIYLPGTFDPNGFHEASDGHGGTDITYTAPTTAATASKLTSAMASFSATSGGLDTTSPPGLDQHTPLLAASSGHA